MHRLCSLHFFHLLTDKKDVLCGRGRSDSHPGNNWFHTLIREIRSLYQNCPKHTKLLVAKQVVAAVTQQRSPPGRFIKSTTTGDGAVVGWTQITYEQALRKASQALRENSRQRWKYNAARDLKRRRTGYDDDNAILIDSDDDEAEIAASASSSASAGTDIFNTSATVTKILPSQQTKRTTLVLVEEAVDKTSHALQALRDPSQHQKVSPTRLPCTNNNSTGNPSSAATATKHRGENQASGNVATIMRRSIKDRNEVPALEVPPAETDIVDKENEQQDEHEDGDHQHEGSMAINNNGDDSFYRPAQEGDHHHDDEEDADDNLVHVDESGRWRDLGEEYYDSDDDSLVF